MCRHPGGLSGLHDFGIDPGLLVAARDSELEVLNVSKAFPRDLSIQVLPTLGPKVCKYGPGTNQFAQL